MVWENPDEISTPLSKRNLTDPDAKSGPDRCQLHQVAVRAESKSASAHTANSAEHAPDSWSLAIEADEVVLSKLLPGGRCRAAVEIAPVRVQTKLHGSDTLRDKRFLFRLDHSHRDIRIASQQVLNRVRQCELNDELGMLLP